MEALVRTGGVGVVLRLTALVTTVLGVVAAMAVPLPAVRQPVQAAVPARPGPGRPGPGAERLGAARRLHPARPFVAVQLASPALDHVPLDAVLTLRFSMPVNTLATQQSFRIVPAVPGGITWSDSTTMVFRPEAPLAYRTAYDVRVSAPPAGMSGAEGDGEFTLHTVSPPVSFGKPFTLTFDDCGPPERIGAILDALADRGLRAIFFPTGQCRDQLPWLVPALVAAGHQVCNHTYSHPVLPRLSNAAIATEIRRGVSVNCNLFRPPYGAVDSGGRVAGVAASLGYRLQLWDVDTRDWAGTPADMMDQMIRAKGGVVLFHMHGTHTVEAIQNL